MTDPNKAEGAAGAARSLCEVCRREGACGREREALISYDTDEAEECYRLGYERLSAAEKRWTVRCALLRSAQITGVKLSAAFLAAVDADLAPGKGASQEAGSAAPDLACGYDNGSIICLNPRPCPMHAAELEAGRADTDAAIALLAGDRAAPAAPPSSESPPSSSLTSLSGDPEER